MHASASGLRRVLLVCALAVAMPAPLLAAWPNDPLQPLPIVATTGLQYAYGTVPDGAGGYFLTWMDTRAGNIDAYAQHVDANGNLLWAANGVPIATGVADQGNPVPVLDGAGGIIVGWIDVSAPSTIYAQRFNSAGVAQWGAGGVKVAVQPSPQLSFGMCSDGAGGAEFAWVYEFGPTDHDVYAQRISPAGARMWGAGGVSVVSLASEQEMAAVATDAASGIWVVWRDNRTASYDVYVQHLDPAGNPLLTPGGTNGETFVPGDLQNVMAVPDGSGGVIASFTLNPYGTYSMEMIHVYPSGTTVSTSISPFGGNASLPTLIADPSGGAYVFWADDRSDIRLDVYGTHVTNYGSISAGWPANGLAIAADVDVYQDTPIAVADGQGGAIVTWLQGTLGVRQILARRFRSDASMPPGWLVSGNPIMTRPTGNAGVVLSPTGTGGAFCNWDLPSSTQYDIVAQRIDAFGQIGSPEPHLAGVKDVPNDQGGHLRVNWTASPLEFGLNPVVYGYQVWHQVPTTLAFAALRTGRARLLGADEVTATSGTPGRGAIDTRRLLRATGTALAPIYWEYAGGVPAQGFAAYSLTASTTGDSIAASNPRTTFMVQAVNSFAAPGPTYPTMYWDSAPDSGYSVDNLPPSLPLGFAGTWSAGAGTTMHWNANAEPDLAGYRLYRGATPSFVPSPSNRIAILTQTWYTDAGAPASCYKLTAFDIHGNESPATLPVGGGITAVGVELPRETGLELVSSNPARAAASLRLDLSAAGHVEVAVFDAGGRRVRQLVDATLAPGRWPLDWRADTESGGRASSGIYYVRLATAGRTWARRIVLLR